MSQLDSLNRFQFIGNDINIGRSKFPVPHTHKTTMTSGRLVPIYLEEILPGDTFQLSLHSLINQITPVVPTMDNAFMDYYVFFVPNRLCTKNEKDWQKICGENDSGFWAQDQEFTLENTGNTAHVKSCTSMSLMNMLGLPIYNVKSDPSKQIKTVIDSVNMMPVRGYIKIWNEWFRDQNVQAPLTFEEISKYILDPVNNLKSDDNIINNGLLATNKFKDYFTSALPAPQKANPVSIALGGAAPVYVRENLNNSPSAKAFSGSSNYVDGTPIKIGGVDNNKSGLFYVGDKSVDAYGVKKLDLTPGQVSPHYADLSDISAVTINELRQLFALQKLLEKDARGGTRYMEMLQTHFGVTNMDSTLQRPEYITGDRLPLNISTVLQTSTNGDNELTPLGTRGGVGLTTSQNCNFIKSFTEHGYLYVLATIRTQQTYSQGVPKLFKRNRRYDWYYPVFANIGEQSIRNYELFLDPNDAATTKNFDAFGFQEAWAEYRYKPNRVSGDLSPSAGNVLLTPYTYTNNFTEMPTLSSQFIVQNEKQISNTLAYLNSTYQFICDFYFDIEMTRPMPLFSTPGFIDHN